MLRRNSKEKAPKAAKPVKEKPVKAKKEKAPKAAKQPKPVKPQAAKVKYKSDLYTLLLLFSFLALVTACIFLYVNNAYDAQFM